MPSSLGLYRNVICVVCMLFYVHGGQTFEPDTAKGYEKGIRKIVFEFSSGRHNNNNNNNNGIRRPSTKLISDRFLPKIDTTRHHSHHANNHVKDIGGSSSTNGTLFSKFPCYRLPPSKDKPSSVHKLRPADIDVVAAIGDSLTAGKAAGTTSVAAVLFDYRGLSWSIGGDGTFATLHSLPNILREYNPDLYGFSNSIGDLMSQTARLNVAKSGATSYNLAFQAALLIQRLKNDPYVHFEKDWKVITILIGANDLCRSCIGGVYTPQRYIDHLKSVLDILHDSVPRTFVNLVEVMPVELARYLPRDAFCKRIESLYCNCAVNPKTEHHYDRLISYREEFQRLTEELVSSGRYDDKEDFTVVAQPFYKNFSLQMIPGTHEIDYSIYAVDCFHPSMKGQSRGGLGLWNNMLQPIGQKSIDWGVTEEILCPTEDYPFIATAKNSKMLRKRFQSSQRRLTRHRWLKKNIPSPSVKQLKYRRLMHDVNSEISNTFQIVGKVKNGIENRKDGKDTTQGIGDGITKSNVLKSHFSKTNHSFPPQTSNNSRDAVPYYIRQEDPETWEIWSIVMGWTLFMSSVLLYCVTIKNGKTKRNPPLPPGVVIATIENSNKY